MVKVKWNGEKDITLRGQTFTPGESKDLEKGDSLVQKLRGLEGFEVDNDEPEMVPAVTSLSVQHPVPKPGEPLYPEPPPESIGEPIGPGEPDEEVPPEAALHPSESPTASRLQPIPKVT